MKKKLAILTDIHGNYPALKAVMDEMDQVKGIDHIFCLGDLIGIGYETNRVLELLCSRDDISFVLGNHDEAILDVISGEEPYSKGAEREHHKWIADRLDRKFISFLSNLPITLTRRYNGKKLHFVHYHLVDDRKFLAVEKQPSEAKLDEIYKTSSYDIVCFGHHHVIHHFKTKERLYLNPSALGCQIRPVAPYAIITISETGSVNVEFKEVEYDNKEFLHGYKKIGVPDSDYILKIFHGNQHLQW